MKYGDGFKGSSEPMSLNDNQNTEKSFLLLEYNAIQDFPYSGFTLACFNVTNLGINLLWERGEPQESTVQFASMRNQAMI